MRLIGTWFTYDRMQLSPPVFPGNPILVVLVGAICGAVMAVGVIEARIVVVAIPVITAPWRLVLLHHPPFGSSLIRGSDAEM